MPSERDKPKRWLSGIRALLAVMFRAIRWFLWLPSRAARAFGRSFERGNRWARMVFIAGCLFLALLIYLPFPIAAMIGNGNGSSLLTPENAVSLLIASAVVYLMIWGLVELLIKAATPKP